MSSLFWTRQLPTFQIPSASTHNQPKSLPFISVSTRLPSSSSSLIPTTTLRSAYLVCRRPSFSVRSSSSSTGGEVKSAQKKHTGMGNLKKTIFDSEEELSVSLAKYTADLSHKFVEDGGAFTVVLSGGSLIKSLRKLTEAPYVESINWSKWHVFWADERVVKKDHPDSNYKLAYDGFLSKVPIPPAQVYAIDDSLSAEGAAEDYETRIKQLVENGVITTTTSKTFPKFDLMLLGMGPDGHIASLFPGHPLLEEKQKWVTFIKDSPKPPPERITLTFPVINSSAYTAMVVCGSGKADPVAAALVGNKGAPALPVGSVKAEDEMYWFLDKEAASKL